MSNNYKILLISNDIIPGMGVSTSAPGLRYFFMYKGLKELGLDVKIALPWHLFVRRWRNKYSNDYISAPVNDDYIFYKNNLQKIIKKTSSEYVIFCNAMHGDKISRDKDVKFIYDMFAAKLFEMISEQQNGYDTIDFKSYTERKKKAFALADAFIVNGKKKLPYIYGFGLANQINVTSLRSEIVHMAVEANFRKDNHCRNNIAIAGAQQKWTKYGPWLEVLYEFLIENNDTTLHLLIPKHPENSSEQTEGQNNEILDKIIGLSNTVSHYEKSYEQYVDFLHNMDLVIDVFEKNIEREHAIVSRTVNAICCGIPVIHSSFTEVSDLIVKYDAGWIIDENGTNLIEILSNYKKHYKNKVIGTKQLAQTEFNYQINAKKILNLIKAL